jgi:hypothetical protein
MVLNLFVFINMKSIRNVKSIKTVATFIGIFCLGWILGFASPSPWEVVVNGKSTNLPIRVIHNMLFVSLEDLAQLPGWKVDINLTSRKVSITTPSVFAPTSMPSSAPKTVSASKTSAVQPPLSTKTKRTFQIPERVRVTVQTALLALNDMETAIYGNLPPEVVQKKMDDTKSIVEQAINSLWRLPKTRILQADLQVALEDLEAQFSLYTAQSQAENNILPWTHPTAQSLLLKYPELRPCHVSKEKTDGLDIGCASNTLTVLEKQDIQDIKSDLNQE